MGQPKCCLRQSYFWGPFPCKSVIWDWFWWSYIRGGRDAFSTWANSNQPRKIRASWRKAMCMLKPSYCRQKTMTTACDTHSLNSLTTYDVGLYSFKNWLQTWQCAWVSRVFLHVYGMLLMKLVLWDSGRLFMQRCVSKVGPAYSSRYQPLIHVNQSRNILLPTNICNIHFKFDLRSSQ